MTDTLHPQVEALLVRYRQELEDTLPSESLDARIDRLVAGGHKKVVGHAPGRRRRYGWAAAAAIGVIAIVAGILIGMRIERGATPAGLVQQSAALPADFSLWPADSVALQIPAEFTPQGTLVAVDPRARSTGKRYWIDVVVSNDGTVRIERILPATGKRKEGVPDGITLQSP